MLRRIAYHVFIDSAIYLLGVIIMYPKFGIPQTLTKVEKERREQARKHEQAIEDARHEAYLKRLNRNNRVGVDK